MRRMDALPELEVIADCVTWDWDMRTAEGRNGGINGADTVASGFSRVSIWTPSLRVDVYGGDLPEREMSAEEALANLLRSAPPTLRTCSLGLKSPWQHTGWQEINLHMSMDSADSRPSLYKSAAELANLKGLRAHVAAACIELQVDEQSEVVHLIRTEVA